jgi:RNA polymerase sigma-70 factor (ECF subfamily)
MAQADAIVDDLFRREAGKISAWLTRLLGPARLDLIEDAIQEAFGTALVRWPMDGIPNRPAAWLAVAARNRAMDGLRREARLEPLDESAAWRLGFSDPEQAGNLDDTLALMFVACHPALTRDEQVMLTLKIVCGFGVKEIARAYLSTDEAVTQRLVRAKRKIRDLRLAFEIPEGKALRTRLPAVIDAIYLFFNGGYTSSEGDALIRRELCNEALRLATLLTEHTATATGEAHALAALICFHQARARARTTEDGALVLLSRQDRTRWDRALIARGHSHLRKSTASEFVVPLHMEAAIAAVHADAASFEETDWEMLSHYYDMLLEMKRTPIVELNAAIAHAHACGPLAGLERLEQIKAAHKLTGYAYFHAARGDMLAKLGRHQEACDAFARALACPMNEAERTHLDRRRQEESLAMQPA